MKVKVRNGNVDQALRVLKRKIGDRLFEVRAREYYEKPTTVRHRKRMAAIARERKRSAKDKL